MDSTFLITYGMAFGKAVLCVLWLLGVYLLAVKTWRTKKFLVRETVFVVVAGIILALFLSMESQYRPKRSISARNPELEEKLEKIDTTPPAAVKWVQPLDHDTPVEKNEAENQEAIDRFKAIK